MHPVMEYMKQHQNEIIEDLKTVVALESPSLNKAVNGRIEWSEGREEGQTMVLAHMDTVFDVGDIAKNPLRIENGRLYGLGARGDGLHTFEAYIEIDSLPERAALMVRMLQEA